jgi:nitrate reductase gamma subunit
MLDWNTLNLATHFLVHQLHYAALLFMIGAYAIKIRQLLAKPLAQEGTPPRGNHGRGIRYSYTLLATPWAMESQRRHWFRYLEFALFHLCMAVAIGVAFVMPWGHEALAAPAVVRGLQGVFGLATVLGVSRILRRLANPIVRAISSPDDYFCIVLLTAWVASGALAAPQTSELWVVMYFSLATFFLFYVPFSKISHYVYWFFVRYYVGKHFGHRGVYPKQRIQNA